MKKILKSLLIVIGLFLFTQCKSTETVIEKDHVLSDTLIKHETQVVTLPVNHTTIIKTPCKNDSLIIANQYLTIGKLRVKIKNLNGQLVIETNTDSIINSKVKEILKHTEKQVETIETIVQKKYIPKWIWYVLGITLIYIIYRIARLFFPIIRLLPY